MRPIQLLQRTAPGVSNRFELKLHVVKAWQPEFIVVDNGEVHFSWAPVRTLWIHTPTYVEAVAAALAWEERYHREKWEDEE